MLVFVLFFSNFELLYFIHDGAQIPFLKNGVNPKNLMSRKIIQYYN